MAAASRPGDGAQAALRLAAHPAATGRAPDRAAMAVTDARHLCAATPCRRWDDVNTAEADGAAGAPRARGREPGARSVHLWRLELAAGQSFEPAVPPRPDTGTQVCLGVLPAPCPPDRLAPYRRPRCLRGAAARPPRPPRRPARACPRAASSIRLRFVAAGTPRPLRNRRCPSSGGSSSAARTRARLFADPPAGRGAPWARERRSLTRPREASGSGLHAPRRSVVGRGAVNAEAAVRLATRPQRRLFSGVRLAAVRPNAALLDHAALGRAAAGDAGIGLRATHRVGADALRDPRGSAAARHAAGGGGGRPRGATAPSRLRLVWSLEEAF